jgi:uncharacterized protein (TIGR03435 family)
MRTPSWSYAFLLVLHQPVYCAGQPAAALQFEAATVKPASPENGMSAHVYPGGRVVMTHYTLKTLIQVAFEIPYWSMSGGEPWTARDEFDVEGKPPASAVAQIRGLRYSLFSIQDDSLRAMLQSLLIERFQLQFHRETKTGDVYLLRRSAGPLQLRPAEQPTPENPDPRNNKSFGSIGRGNGRYSIFATFMPDLARFASAFIIHTPVIDQTGLEGAFDYRQKSDFDATNNVDDSLGPFRDFLSEAGLKLDRDKGPVETFVIDHAEKPSAN